MSPRRRLETYGPTGRGAEAALWLAVLAWTALWAGLRASPSGISWHFFRTGGRLLLHGAGLHLYADHPELQIGPLALLVAAPLTALPTQAGQVCGQVLMTAALPAALLVLSPLVPGPHRRTRILLAALVLAPAWTVLSVRWAHLDDALALLLVCVALRLALADRAVLTGLALALAADAKPWAVLAVPLVLLLSRSAVGAAAAAAGVVVGWAPFLVADTGTVSALHPPVAVDHSSVLSLLGYRGRLVPGWDRTAQLVLAPLAALIAVRRGAWAAALLAGVAVRLALDPQDIAYYAAGATLAAAVFDLLGSTRRIPWATLVTFAAFWQPFVRDFAHRFQTSHGLALWWFSHPHAVAAIHLGWAVLAVAVALAAGPTPRPPYPRRRPTEVSP